MLKEIIQDRKQGMYIESLIKQKSLSVEIIAKRLGTSPGRLAKIIWGEKKNAVIQEGIAMILGFGDWKSLSAFAANDREMKA